MTFTDLEAEVAYALIDQRQDLGDTLSDAFIFAVRRVSIQFRDERRLSDR